MGFLAPLLLLGLAGLAVPVLIHLIHRERSQIIQFPSLMFLQKVPFRSMRRQKIRHWLLLLVRCAALVLLVTAFARPFFKRSAIAAGALAGGREVVIMLDQSYSMGYSDHWDLAQAAALEAVDALEPDDRATVILFSRGARAGARSTTDRASLRAAINSAGVGVGVTRYGPALELAEGILEQSELQRREAILISDFQRSGWESAESTRFSGGIELTPISVADANTTNVVVSAVAFEREPFSTGERVTATARLVNRGDAPIPDLDVTLDVDNVAIETQQVSLESNGTTTVTFEPFIASESHTRGTVRVTPDALPNDDVFQFVLSPGQTVSVLIVESDNPNPDASLYLTRALAIGSTPTFQAGVKPLAELEAADFDGRSVVMLNDTVPASGEVADALAAFVENGGGLLVVLGERMRWPAEGPDLLPGSFGPPADRVGSRGNALGYIDYSHPVFEVFSAPRSGDLSSARFFRYRPLTVSDPESVRARFDDGTVALAERQVGRGRVLTWSSTLDSFWNDLALKPVFLPFVHQLAKHLAGFVAPTECHTAAQVLDVASLYASIGDRLDPDTDDPVAISPSGERVAVTIGEESVLLTLDEQGFYEIHTPGAEVDRPVTVAVNPDRAESDLTSIDPDELAGAVTGRAGGAAEGGGATIELTPEEEEQRQAVWWYLLVVAFLLLAADTVISNRLSRTAL